MITILNAIQSINPTAEISINDNDINTLLWFNDTPVISKADILAKQAELQTAYDAKEYQRDRAKEYPSIADQLDDIYHNGIDAWKETIKITKDKYPK
jgi:hypothetical protein